MTFRRRCKKVAEAGGKVLGDPVDIPGVGTYVSFTDTEGNRVSMLQPLPRMSGTADIPLALFRRRQELAGPVIAKQLRHRDSTLVGTRYGRFTPENRDVRAPLRWPSRVVFRAHCSIRRRRGIRLIDVTGSSVGQCPYSSGG